MAWLRKDKSTGRYYVRWRDEDGKEREKAAGTDKGMAQRLVRKVEAEVTARRNGLSDPAAERLAGQGRRPLEEHIAEFHRYMQDRGATPKHSQMTARFVRVIVELAEARALSDLTPAAVARALGVIRREGAPLPQGGEPGTNRGRRRTRRPASPRTANAYLVGLRAFVRWAVRDGRLAADPLAHMEKFDEEVDRRRRRRALTPVEVSALIEAARGGPDLFGMDGESRAILYGLMVGTGLRKAEAGSITRSSFDLDSTVPTVTIQAAYSKRRQEDVQPLPGWLVVWRSES